MAMHKLVLWASLLVAMFLLLLSSVRVEGIRPVKDTYSRNMFNVDSYGARGDGHIDDTKALANTWAAACSSLRPAPVVVVPKDKTYLLKPIVLSGPCKSSIQFMMSGRLLASSDRSDWNTESQRRWVMFDKIDGLNVTGGGTLDGNGEVWWQHSCKINKANRCTEAPTALKFHACTNVKVEDLTLVNSQQIHVSVEHSTDVRLAHLTITAPGWSPNTDGIHVSRSRDVHVDHCTIKTGDDCVSVESGTHDLTVTNVVCGPGHGISIGSLGDRRSEADVSGITIDTARLYGTTNGARIKTYQGGSGYARNITYQNIVMDNVRNPIIINQNYCESHKPCKKTQASAVEVSGVLFKNITGTSATEEAIKLSCSTSVPCHGIVLEDVQLTFAAEDSGSAAKSTCQSARWTTSGTVEPTPCRAET